MIDITEGMVLVEGTSIHAYKGKPVILTCHVSPETLEEQFPLYYPVSIKWVKVTSSQEEVIAVNGAANPATANNRYKPFVEFEIMAKEWSVHGMSYTDTGIPAFKLLIEGQSIFTDDQQILCCKVINVMGSTYY